MASSTAGNRISTDDTTLIVLSAPSVKNKYYSAVFPQIIDFMVQFANIVHGKDQVVILVNQDTLPYFQGKVSPNLLMKAKIEDIWLRDFSPVIPSRQVKFKYSPNYLSKPIYTQIENSFEHWFLSNGLTYHRKSSIVLDGGNVVDNPAGTRAIITDRILSDNPSLKKNEVKHQLKQLLDVNEVAIIREVPDDTTGHSDGMVMWANNNKILLQEMSEPERTEIITELNQSFPDVEIVEIPDYYKYETWKGFTSACNIFVNSIVTDKYIYMPTFNGPHDEEMLGLFRSHTEKIVVPVPAQSVCFMGGSARCLSWQVKGALKEHILAIKTTV